MKRNNATHFVRGASAGIMLVGGIFGGCATVPRQAGFKSVSVIARKRLKTEVIWAQNRRQQMKLHAIVARLLAHPLTPADAVEVALLNNPLLQGRYEQLGISEAQVIRAGVISNPVLSFDFRFPAAPNYGWDASVAQDFADILLLPARKKESEAQFAATKSLVSQSVIQLATRTRQAYYRVVGDSQLIELETSVKAGEAAALDLAKKLRQAGNIPSLTYDRQLAMYEHIRLQLAMDKANYLEDRERMFRLMGLWGVQAQVRLPNRLPIPIRSIPFNGLTAMALRRSLLLKAARHELQAAGVDVRVAGWAGILPGATIGMNYVRDPDVRGTLGPAISVPVPIFSQGQPSQAMARARYLAAWRHYEALAIDIRSRVRARWVAVRADRRRVEFYQRVMLPLRRRMLAETQRSYNGMFDSGFLLMQAKIDEINTARSYVKALESYWMNRAKLADEVGGRLPARMSKTPSAPRLKTRSTQGVKP